MVHSPRLGYSLSVMVGRIGMHEVHFLLTTKEVDSYQQSGVKFLEELAEKVRYTSVDYSERHREFVERGVPAWRCPPPP